MNEDQVLTCVCWIAIAAIIFVGLVFLCAFISKYGVFGYLIVRGS